MELIQEIRSLQRLRDRIDELETELKAQKAQASQLEQEILDAMELEEMDDLKLDGRRYSYHASIKGNVLAANRDRFMEELRAHGLGDIIKPTVHPGTLNSLVKEYYETEGGLPDWAEPLIHVFTVRTLQARKTKK